MEKPDSYLNRKYILAISLVSAMGGLLFGYDWVVIGGAKPFYEQFFAIADSEKLQGWAISCALIGCLFGSLVSGMLSDRYGRKRLLILAAFLFIISALGTGASNRFDVFVLYRILGGIGIGLASNLSPMYISEVTPANIRGSYVSINQLTIVIGILLAQVINWQIAEPMDQHISGAEILHSWNGQTGWRYMFWAELIPAGLFFLCMWFIPESPRWLATQKQHEKVLAILNKIGGSAYAKKATIEIEESLSDSKKQDFRTLLKPGILAIIVIGVVLAVFQQWCGINVIFMYAEEVFTSAGYSVSEMLFNIVVTGSVNLLFTFVAMALVDKIGRKALMLIGAGGLAIIYTILGTLYFLNVKGLPMLILVVSAIACYAMTLAPVTWVVLSEIFPNRMRGAAMAIATFSLWLACALLAYFFPIINSAIQAYGSFWLFAVICLGGFFFIKTRLVETKGKTLEEIEKTITH